MECDTEEQKNLSFDNILHFTNNHPQPNRFLLGFIFGFTLQNTFAMGHSCQLSATNKICEPMENRGPNVCPMKYYINALEQCQEQRKHTRTSLISSRLYCWIKYIWSKLKWELKQIVESNRSKIENHNHRYYFSRGM